MSNSISLKDKVAIITGGGRGIGKAIARRYAEAGANVVIASRKIENLQATASELAGLPGRVIPIACHVGRMDQIENLVGETESQLGPVDILVNNAGLTRDNLSMRMKDEEWDDVIAVNMTATFKLAKAVQRGMMKRRWGRIINIASVVGVMGNPGQCNYVASKAGMIGWSKAMAQEIASRNITVNCVAPGFIATSMTEVLTDDQKAKISSTIPMGRMGSAGDIAAAVTYLASDEAGYVTGATIHVNGGMAMV